MILDNNPRIDTGTLAQRVRGEADASRRDTAVPPVDLPPPGFALGWKDGGLQPGAADAPGWRQRLRAVPVLGATLAFLLRRWRRLLGPGAALRRRLRAVPLLGATLHFLWTLPRLPRFRDDTAAALERLRGEIERLDAVNADAGMRIARLEQRAVVQARTLQLLEQRLQAASGAASVPGPTPSVPSSALPAGAFYREFEDRFRGSRASVRERLLRYLPLVERVREGAGPPRCVDLGCGRGEWLELLRDQGIEATGIDLDAGMVQVCVGLGLDARAGDGIAWLESSPPESVDVLTAFHVIEHLDFAGQLRLLDAALRVLSPRGVAILETPNPENLLVATQSFYIDPSHQRPLPPQTAEFLALQRGFARVEILRANPCAETDRIAQSGPLAERMNHLLYGPQDYALVAWKRA